jgi:hypothetical protein
MRTSKHAGRHSGCRATLVALLACLAVVAAVLLVRGQGDGGGTTVAGRPVASAASSDTVPAAAAPTTAVAPGTHPAPSATTGRPTTHPATRVSAATSTAGPVPGKRTLTLVNRLNQTIWPAIAADPTHPVAATGWKLAPGASLSFPIPDHWDVRVWARTGCTFNAAGNGHCVTGDCAGHFQCGRTWGQFPSTLAEFNLNAWNGMDFYDVSLVEGNNLPMWINNSGGRSADPISANGCSPAGCTHDANKSCPQAMQRTHDGAVVACLSACLVLGTDQTCCTGPYAARSACTPSTWPIDSAAVFKKAEPFAYSYVNDDATSVLSCSGECNYRITWGVSP